MCGLHECTLGSGGVTRDGCKHLTTEDNDALRECFEETDPTAKQEPREICVYCRSTKILSNNITKKLMHIATCGAFKEKCSGEEALSLASFRDRVLLACDKYGSKTKFLEASSEKMPPPA